MIQIFIATLVFPPPIYHDRNGIDIPAQFSSHSNLLAIDTQIAIPSIEDYQPNRTNLLVPTCLPISIVFRLLSPLLCFPPILPDSSFGIQLSAIWNVEAGQRVNPFPIRVVAVILKER